jgi:hypothetical protein
VESCPVDVVLSLLSLVVDVVSVVPPEFESLLVLVVVELVENELSVSESVPVAGESFPLAHPAIQTSMSIADAEQSQRSMGFRFARSLSDQKSSIILGG